MATYTASYRASEGSERKGIAGTISFLELFFRCFSSLFSVNDIIKPATQSNVNDFHLECKLLMKLFSYRGASLQDNTRDSELD